MNLGGPENPEEVDSEQEEGDVLEGILEEFNEQLKAGHDYRSAVPRRYESFEEINSKLRHGRMTLKDIEMLRSII